MKNKRLLLLGLCAVACLAILSILYASSPLSKEIYRANFERNIEPDVFLEMKAILDLKFNSFYFAGTSKTKIYLGNSTAPAYLLVTNKTLSDSQRININIELDSVKEIRRFRIAIDSPYFFISHGTLPQILRGTIGSWNAKPIMNDSNYYFIEAVPISKNTFALRSYSTLSKGYELAKKTTDSFKFEPTLLEKQIDGMFCTDGTLHFDKSKNQLVYLYYYRNQYIVADTNMNLTYRGQTIDTFRTARIQVSQIGNENEMMLSAPPVQTNGTSYVADGML
jgi:hypothetical protein